MRKHYEMALKEFLCEQIYQARIHFDLTQAEMAERLEMDTRTYIDLDHGKSGGSAVTLALYFVYFCKDPILFQEQLRHVFEKEKANMMQSVF